MRRREARPGRLIVGLAALATAVLYGGDAAGAWHTRWYTALPLLAAALALAAVVGIVGHAVRRRRPGRSESTDSTGAPTTTSGSQAMR
ncbi:hypothetical protein AB0910_17140 [Streptomyces sp. NPDC047002]|uniref:hypothetical protein n=1 Tax=Streptomyces sp. NPDC047002 TaxID=3155475 RepID=UPI003456CC28